MSLSNLAVTTQVFAGQHIRQYPGATRNEDEDTQYLEAKQYRPIGRPEYRAGDVTLIGACAVSFPKELYEPLWEELYARCKDHGLRIYSIWTVDKSDHGASSIPNENTQGDDPSASDLARDLLHMTNIFPEEMHPPLTGFGHSLGGTALLELANMHPRLFASLILVDPVIGPSIRHAGTILVNASVRRPDLWRSHEEAEEAFNSTKAFQRWDSRVQQLWLRYGLRVTPTLLHPEPGMVTLRTPKSVEAWNYCRPWFDPLPSNGNLHTIQSRIKYPDANSNILNTHPFYRPEAALVWDSLPNIRPGVLYIFPASGPLSSSESMTDKVTRTGKGINGSGGQEMGRVEKVVFQNAGHLVPLEMPAKCAESISEWLAQDLKMWHEHRKIERTNKDNKSVNKVALSDEYVHRAKDWFAGRASTNTSKL